MYALWTIATATYGEITRRPLYYFTLLFFGLLIYCSHFLTQFTFFQEMNMIREMGMATMSLWGFIIVVILSGILVTQELEDRTAVTLLSKPIHRASFLLGKYFGVLLAVLLGMGLLAGVLFFTLWWEAKTDLFGDPRLATACLLAGLASAAAGSAIWFAGAWRAHRFEATTAVRAPQAAIRAGLALLTAGAVLLVLAGELATGTSGRGDMAHYRMYRESGGSYSVWDYVLTFMRTNGALVLSGFALSFLQVAVLAAINISLAAFAPPIVSVAGTALCYLLGNLSTYMMGSLERMGSAPVSSIGRFVYYLLPNLAYYNLQTHFSEGRIVSLGYVTLALVHAVLYSSLVFTVSCALFGRREIR